MGVDFIRQQWWLTVLCATGAACCARVPARPLSFVSRQKTSATHERTASYADQIDGAARTVIDSLHAEASKLVADTSFQLFVEDIDAVAASADGDPISGRRLYALYTGRDPNRPLMRICYRTSSGGRSETANTGFAKNIAGCGTADEVVAAVTLRSATLTRARSTKREERACAINTIAHEWAHIVSASSPEGTGHQMQFLDDDHDHQAAPVASYVLGAVAQCLYLKQSYESGRFDVRKCIEAVGTNAFDSSSCKEGWGKQFL